MNANNRRRNHITLMHDEAATMGDHWKLTATFLHYLRECEVNPPANESIDELRKQRHALLALTDELLMRLTTGQAIFRC